MDTVLLFALPLVGGLIFCSGWNFTRWRVAREEGHRLYFRAVLFGALIFAFIAWIRPYVESLSPQFSEAVKLAKQLVEPMAKDKSSAPAVADLAITCFLAMLAGSPLAWLLNLVFWRSYWLRRAIQKDDLESFLLDAAEREISIVVTMDDRKVYVGYVVEGFDPAVGRKCIELLPLMSGYRDQEKHKINFTTFYTQLYGQGGDRTAPLPAPLEHLKAEDFITLLPADRIVSYRLFDALAYSEFQKPKSTELPNPAVPSDSTPSPRQEM